jgi:hypothetical protein
MTPLARALATLCALLVLASGCGGNGSDTTTTGDTAPTANGGQARNGGDRSGHGPGGEPKAQGGSEPKLVNATQEDFDPSSFSDPVLGLNEWLPLKPGTQWVREGLVTVGTRRLPHRVVTTVTDVSKEIDGVRTAVILDQDFNGGEIAEQALDYVAEDEHGNVWYLGSYTESYEAGQFITATDAWLAGLNGAEPGLLMLADPQPGVPAYPERILPGGESATSEVADVGISKCVPFKCYKDVLVVEENGAENKYYARGVGQIKTEPLFTEGKEEVEELINLTQLSPRGLRELSTETLKLDEHARTTVPDVFGDAAVAKRTL